MKKLCSAGAALSLSLGMIGCSGPVDTPPERAIDGQRRVLEACGLTSKDLYMIKLSLPLWNSEKLWLMPCEEILEWLDAYRKSHPPDPDFLRHNPMELTRPSSWTDLRFLMLGTGYVNDPYKNLPFASYVLVDFDAELVYSRAGELIDFDLEESTAVDLRRGEANALVSALEATSASWEYPYPWKGEVIPEEIHITRWQIAWVTRDKSLYRFEEGGWRAPEGFVEIHEAFWALAKP